MIFHINYPYWHKRQFSAPPLARARCGALHVGYLTHWLTHSLTDSLTHSLTHSLTDSLTPTESWKNLGILMLGLWNLAYSISRPFWTFLSTYHYQARKLVCVHIKFLRAQAYISGCIHARTFKLGMKHLWTISRRLDSILNQVHARKLVCMHTIFLRAWDNISGCIHARTVKLGMKNL